MRKRERRVIYFLFLLLLLRLLPFLQDIVGDLSSPATKGKIDKDQRENLMASNRKSDRLAKIERAKEMENQDFIDQNSPQVVSWKPFHRISLPHGSNN